MSCRYVEAAEGAMTWWRTYLKSGAALHLNPGLRLVARSTASNMPPVCGEGHSGHG